LLKWSHDVLVTAAGARPESLHAVRPASDYASCPASISGTTRDDLTRILRN